MKKHLEYNDQDSNKFWSIETNGLKYTVTYGKTGTGGTSKTKIFESEEECLLEAQKQLAQKIKKGYSENGIRANIPEKKSSKELSGSLIAEYDAIVIDRQIDNLLPFLKKNAKGNLDVLKKNIRKNRTFWLTFVDLSKEPQYKKQGSFQWGNRGDDVQERIILLSAIALFREKEIMSWSEVFNILNKPNDPYVKEVLEWAKPNWIEVFLLDKIKKEEWRTFNYFSLVALEENSFIKFSPELFANSLTRHSLYGETDSAKKYIDYIVDTKTAYKRDVPQLLNYEVPVHSAFFKKNENEDYNAHLVFMEVFEKLLIQEKIDRIFLIESILLVQTKEWNNSIKSFYRKLLTEIVKPEPEELIDFQEVIFASFHNSFVPVVSFGTTLIKTIYSLPEFNIASFLEWVEPLMMRSDAKGAIKSIVILLEKIYKLHPEYGSRVASVMCDIFVVPDLSLQERTAKALIKLASKGIQLPLEKLADYSPLMQGNIKIILSDYLKDVEEVYEPEQKEYVFNGQKEVLLTDEVNLPSNWNELMYLFGSFIYSEEVLDGEILLNAFIIQQDLFPPDYTNQLEAYSKQLNEAFFNSHDKLFLKSFFQLKFQNILRPVKIVDNTRNKVRTLKIIDNIIEAAQKRINTNVRQSLLCFPTHKPHWVAPKVLLERLIYLKENKIELNYTDLAIAISRMPRENIDEALPLLEKLDGELKKLMEFCLGVTKEMPLAQKKSFLNKLLLITNNTSNYNTEALWAVAARTFYPEESFSEFQKGYLKNVPFVEKPFDPELRFKECYNDIYNYRTRTTERSKSWYKLEYSVDNFSVAPQHFLYGLDINSGKKTWESFLWSKGNVKFWHSLMPQNINPLSLYLTLETFSQSSEGGEVAEAYLHILNEGGFKLSGSALLNLACSLFLENKKIRLLATEVLINLIEKRHIDIKVFSYKTAFLVNNNYGPFGRMAEALISVKDVSPMHNSALLLITEGIFGNLVIKEKLPVNFKKLVECYVDLLYKTEKAPAEKIITFFESYKNTASLKPLISQIQTIP
ncbi:DUF6493 family protein [Flavobacterium rakeshii]|uniref:DUF6493 family protein n=1 Tax=Flavobacterium rakeshii TaxID=1038845 RepID=UPI002E7B1A74|nr:DUF6493 family protein [Flavobacterium rakeshii]MEE1897575.1 DUF6493 family protein [Flavobacterium rakeshii]